MISIWCREPCLRDAKNLQPNSWPSFVLLLEGKSNIEFAYLIPAFLRKFFLSTGFRCRQSQSDLLGVKAPRCRWRYASRALLSGIVLPNRTYLLGSSLRRISGCAPTYVAGSDDAFGYIRLAFSIEQTTVRVLHRYSCTYHFLFCILGFDPFYTSLFHRLLQVSVCCKFSV